MVASTTSDDPFAELTEGGDRGSKGHGQGDPEPQVCEALLALVFAGGRATGSSVVCTIVLDVVDEPVGRVLLCCMKIHKKAS